MDVKGSAKLGTAIGTAVSIDTNGEMASTWGGSDEGDFNGRGVRRENGSWGVKTEGKVAVRGCAQF